jgi:DNA-binding NarL/FixJ family response regulator
VTIILQSRAEELVFEIQHNGSRELTPDLLPGATQRLQQIGGVVETEHSSSGFYRWLVRLPRPSPVQITPREQEVIEGVTEGLSNKEIARRLSISPRTVNFHLDNLYSKLGVNTRTEAAIFALRQGWVQRALEPMHKDAPV